MYVNKCIQIYELIFFILHFLDWISGTLYYIFIRNTHVFSNSVKIFVLKFFSQYENKDVKILK